MKSSRRGNVDTTVENFVNPKDLNALQRAYAAFAKELGVPIVFFRGAKNLHGVHANGISYYNVNAKFSHEFVYWHEFGHWLKNNQPTLFNQLLDAAGITDEQIAEKRKSRPDLSDDELREEIICDAMSDIVRRTGLLNQIGKKNSSLIQRLISWARTTLDRFTDWFHTRERGLTTAQRAKMYDAFGKIARQIEDADGRKIFRYNSRTHEVELVDGRKLPTVDMSTKPKYSTEAETKKAAVTVTGDKFGEYTDIKDLRKKAIQYYKEHLQGTSVENKTLGKIDIDENGLVEFTSAGRKKVESTSAQAQKLLLVKHLPQLIRDATEIQKADPLKERHKDDIFYHMENIATIDGKSVPVHITLVKHNTGRIQFYNHTVEMENAPVNSAEPVSSKEALGLPPVDASSESTISQEERGGKVKYSLDGSDNSGESLLQRISNKLPEWIGGRTDLNERRNKGITRKLSELSGYKVAFGHVAGADETIIDDLQKVIRTRHAYDWEKILPAVGAKIARNLKVSATPEMSNYIVDWILTGAPNNTSAEAKAFAKAARENPALFELLNSVRNDFQEYADMSANERVKSKIVSEPPKKSLFERIGELRRNFKEEFIDDLDPLKRMLTRIKADFGAEIAAKLEAGIDPYKAARLYRGSGGMVDIMIHGKAKDVANIRAALQSMYPNVNFSYFKPLETIIAEAGGLKNLLDFEAFCLAMQTKEIHEHNRKHPTEKIKPTFSGADCDEIIAAGAEKFGAAQKDLVVFSKTTLSMMYDAGLLTNESYSRMIRKWKNYVPMARVFDENEEFDFNDSLKQREGSERDIFSPVQKIIANTQEFVRRAERNKVKLNLANLARCGGYGEFVEEVATKKPNVKDIVTFHENGVRKFLQTDPEIVRALNNLQTQSDGVWIFRMLNAATSFMRSALTVFNPDYSAGNIFRDTADAFIHNKYYGTKARPWLAFTDAWRGLMGMVRRDADYYEWLAHGGAQSALVSPDINYSQRMINDITKTARRRWLSKNFFSQVLDTMQKVAEYSEYATRLGTYKRAKTALGTTVTDKRKAALMSRDATIDFARAGSSMRAVNRFAAFSNAAVQGIDRTIRTFDPHKLKTADGRKELFGAVIRLGMAAILPAILQFALNYADDDRRKKYNQRPDWERETYWIYGDGLRIPKGMDFSLRLASTLTDEFLTSWADDNPFEAKRFAQTLKDAAPSLTATIFTPLVEVGFNRSWFRNAPISPTTSPSFL